MNDKQMYELVLGMMADQAGARQQGAGPSYRQEKNLGSLMDTSIPPANLDFQQDWSEGLNQRFDPEGKGYDIDTARRVGLQPDATGHWPSRDPSTGMLLKGRGHPTWPLTEQGELNANHAIEQGAGGRYFSQPVGPATANQGMMNQFSRQRQGRRQIQGPDYLQNWQAYKDSLSQNFPLHQDMESAMSPEAIRAYANAAMTAGPGILAGPKALTAPPFMGLLDQSGLQARWKERGVATGAEGLPRFEISDQSARLTPEALRLFELGFPQTKISRMGNVLQHDELYSAYPDIRDVPVLLRNEGLPGGSSGFSQPGRVGVTAATKDDMLEVLIHELQHQVQRKEGFAAGGNLETAAAVDLGLPRMSDTQLQSFIQRMLGMGFNDPKWRNYGRLAGEVEARNVVTRMKNPEFRKFVPEFTEDIPREWQRVRMEGDIDFALKPGRRLLDTDKNPNWLADDFDRAKLRPDQEVLTAREWAPELRSESVDFLTTALGAARAKSMIKKRLQEPK